MRFCLSLLTLLCFASHAADVVVIGDKITGERLEIPASYSLLDELDLQEAKIDDIRDAAEILPNFMVVGSSSSRYITPYIRGQGNQDLNLPDEISVSFYLDEVPLPRYAFETELIDIQRLELLRGPQGTLFGKNTQAGAVLLTSRPPRVEGRAHEVSLGAGNLGQRQVRAKSNYEVFSPKLTARTAIALKERDGWIQDTLLNRKLGQRETQALHQAFLYQPNDRRTLSLKLGAQREDGDDPFFVKRQEPAFPVSGQDLLPNYRRDLLTSSLKWEERLSSSSTLTGITAFHYYDFGVKYDEADAYIARNRLVATLGQAGAQMIINDPTRLFRDIKEYDRQFFQELRLKTLLTEKDQLTVGVNASQTNYRLVNFVNTFTTGPAEISQNIQLKGLNLSGFADWQRSLSERLEMTLGGRLNYDEKRFQATHSSTALSFYAQDSKKDFTDLTGKLALSYAWSDDQRTYTSLARGYQPGGYPSFQFNNYSGLSVDQEAFDKSSSLAYELGHKARFFEGRLETEASLYYNQVRDKQVRVRDPNANTSYYENVDSTIFGGELEARAELMSGFKGGASLGYTNSRFDETIVSGTQSVLRANDRLANVPYWNGNAFLQYGHDLFSGLGYWVSRLSYSYRGGRFGENINRTHLPSYGLWNFTTSLESEAWGVSLKVENLFDKLYDSQAYYYTSLSEEVSSPGLPRLISVEATYRF